MEQFHIGQNVKRWRVARGLSQAALASRAGLSRAGLQKIEQGSSIPRASTLRSIAHVLEVRVADLTRPVAALQAVRFRAHKRLAHRENVLAEVSLLLDDFNELEEITGERVPYRLRTLAQELAGASSGYDRAVYAARRAREALGLAPEESIRDLGGLVESAGVKLLLPRLSSDGFFGLSIAEESGGPAIAVNVWDRISVERWIFTTAHELGHLLLHLDAYDVNKVDEDPDEEREASIFASHFLMPESVFRKEWEEAYGLPLVDRVLKVKRMFRVSYRTVLYRLIENGTYGPELWHLFASEYRRKTGKSLRGADEPAPLSASLFLSGRGLKSEEPEHLSWADFVPDRKYALVRKALERELISLSRAAEVLHLDLTQMRQLAAGWLV